MGDPFMRGWAAVLLGLLNCASGCNGSAGPPTAHLQGTVTLAGQPLPADASGQVVFSPTGTDQAKPTSAAIKQGQYDSPNTPMGPVKASFEIFQPSGPEFTTDRGVKVRDVKSLVPEGSAVGVEIDVTGDNLSQNFDLK